MGNGLLDLPQDWGKPSSRSAAVLVLQSGLGAVPLHPHTSRPASDGKDGSPTAGSQPRGINAHYPKALSLAYRNDTVPPPYKGHDSYTLKCFETSEIAIVLLHISS